MTFRQPILAFAGALSTVTGFYAVIGSVVSFALAGTLFRFSDAFMLAFTVYLSVLAIVQAQSVLVEQRQSAEVARRRDEAMHAKLDSLLHGVADADDALIGIEKKGWRS